MCKAFSTGTQKELEKPLWLFFQGGWLAPFVYSQRVGGGGGEEKGGISPLFSSCSCEEFLGLFFVSLWHVWKVATIHRSSIKTQITDQTAPASSSGTSPPAAPSSSSPLNSLPEKSFTCSSPLFFNHQKNWKKCSSYILFDYSPSAFKLVSGRSIRRVNIFKLETGPGVGVSVSGHSDLEVTEHKVLLPSQQGITAWTPHWLN